MLFANVRGDAIKGLILKIKFHSKVKTTAKCS